MNTGTTANDISLYAGQRERMKELAHLPDKIDQLQHRRVEQVVARPVGQENLDYRLEQVVADQVPVVELVLRVAS